MTRSASPWSRCPRLSRQRREKAAALKGEAREARALCKCDCALRDARQISGMKIKEFAFVAYPVTDLARARKFYEGVLGLAPSHEPKGEVQWVEYEVGPHTLGIGCHELFK